MTGTYSKGESGTVMDTINVFKSNDGDNVFIEMITEINYTTVSEKRFSIERDKFRELIKDVL